MWSLITTGVLGSFHCVGMCGGFVLALDREGRRPWRRVGTQALFHLGKTTTYVLLGALVGTAGTALLRAPWFPAAQAVLSVLAGALMILFGLQFLGLVKEFPLGSLFGPTSLYGRAFKAVVNLRGPIAPITMGALTGFLPCPLVYSFLATALATGSLVTAMGVMAILGFASVPALGLVVFTGATLKPGLRARFVKVAGLVILFFGLVTLLRGLAPDWVHAWMPGHVHPA